MTALEQIIKEAKSLRRKFPNRYKHLANPWRDGYMKQASAIYASKHKGRSPVGKKRHVSNVETRSKSHVDKNRVTANIQIGSSGISQDHAIQRVIMKRALRARGYSVDNNIDDVELQKGYRKLTGRKVPSLQRIRKMLSKGKESTEIINSFK